MLISRFQFERSLCINILLLISFSAFGQTNPETKISIAFNNVPLAQALQEISQKSGVVFSYNPKKIPASERITYQASNKSVLSILNDFSTSYDLKYMQVENQIVLKPEKKTSVQKADLPVTLSGYVKNQKTGEALIGSTIYIT
ncbi:MAG TPA: DUF4974 domain-containing protein, partial [Chryseosolibacter sp.]